MPYSYALVIAAVSFLPFLIQKFTGKFIWFAACAIVAGIFQGLYLFGPSIIWLLVLTYLISTVAELVSLKTPIACFGVKYAYNLKHPFFSSKIFLLGVYPLEISLAWVILKYLSFSLGIIIASAFGLPLFWEVLLIPLILVSLDFMFDPVSVRVSKLWSWERGSGYFGIPWQNFLGWYMVGLVTTLIYAVFGGLHAVGFDYLLVLPVIFYAYFLQHIPKMLKLDPVMGLIGSLPAVIWTILGAYGLYVLWRP